MAPRVSDAKSTHHLANILLNTDSVLEEKRSTHLGVFFVLLKMIKYFRPAKPYKG